MSDATSTQRFEGVISITGRGTGYVAAPGFERDIEIPTEGLNTAMNRDLVEVKLTDAKPQSGARRRPGPPRQQGAVVRILERNKTRFVGVLHKDNGVWTLKPDDRRAYFLLAIPDAGGDMQEGHKAAVELARWEDANKLPESTLITVLGPEGNHEVEMQAIVLDHGFESGFPEDVEREAQDIAAHKEELTKHDIVNRRDMRETTTFTIDPDDAKDFDDALSVRFLENGNTEVGIHIADVSHFVTPGSALDREARERGTSIYLVDRTIPMLPEALSNDVCSLNPDEDRLTFSAVFELDGNGEVVERWFGRTVIHSDKRFTYENAQEALDAGDGPFHKELSIVDTLGKKLRKERFKEGAIDFDQDEIKFQLDEDGVPIGVTTKPRLDTNKLIEEFMLLANREVAAYVWKLAKNVPSAQSTFVYRIHDVPNPDKIEELALFVRAIGHDFDTDQGAVTAKEINRLFKEIEGSSEEDLIKTATIRSMAKAIYSTKNIGHFGLSFKYYTHFTSPIRRYPDVIVHRILASHLDGSLIGADELKQYERLALRSSEREAEAVQAERDSIKYKQVEFMKGRVGEVFTATISGVTDFGIFVQENDTHAEGLVRMQSLGDDYYVFDKENYRLVGQRTKRAFRLGDEVTVRLAGADMEERTLDFAIVKEQK